jgi:hypothetical protein
MRLFALPPTLVVLATLLLAPAARGESAFGIEVYPGARQDKLSDGYCRRVDASLKTVRCFRTSDSFAKVRAFYDNLSTLELMPMAKSMPADYREQTFARGEKKVWEWCRKEKDAACEGMLPSVRIVSPWSDNLNLSPTTPASAYPGKDVIIFIRQAR